MLSYWLRYKTEIQCSVKTQSFLKASKKQFFRQNLLRGIAKKLRLNKLNKVNNKFSLEGPTVVSELHLKQLIFTYSFCRPFTKYK